MSLDSVAEMARDMAENVTEEQATPKTVTYRQWVSTVFSPEQQQNVTTYTDTETTALRKAYTTKEISNSQGSLRIGDVQWLIAGNNLTVDPTEHDIVVEGTNLVSDPQWQVLSLNTDIANALHRVDTRKVS